MNASTSKTHQPFVAMGVRSNFKQTIHTRWPGAVSVVQLSRFAGESVAVDVFGLLYFYNIVYGERWLEELRKFFLEQIRHNVDLVMVFDGASGPEKLHERQRRQAARDSLRAKLARLRWLVGELECCQAGGYDPSPEILQEYETFARPKLVDRQTVAHVLGEKYVVEDEQPVSKVQTMLSMLTEKVGTIERQLCVPNRQSIRQAEELCSQFGWIWLTAPGEADQVCAWLSLRGHVAAVLSEDSDMIPLGCSRMLTRVKRKTAPGSIPLRTNDEWNWYQLDLVKLQELSGLSMQQIRQWAICCGTDFNCNMSKIGSITSLRMIQQFGGIEGMARAGIRVAEMQPQRQGVEPVAADEASQHPVTDPEFWRRVEGFFEVGGLDQDPACQAAAAAISQGQERSDRINQRRQMLEGRWGLPAAQGKRLKRE